MTQRADRLEGEFVKGKLDAVVTYDPYRIRIAQAGGIQIFDSSKIPGEIADALVVRQATAENPPPALRTFVSAWFQAVEYVSKIPRTPRDAWPREKM